MSRKPVLIVSSVVAHAAAVVALVVMGWWNIEKLPIEAERTAYLPPHVPTDRPLPGGGDGKPAPLGVKKKGRSQQTRRDVNDVTPAPLLEEDIDGAADIGDPDGTDEDGPFGDPHGSIFGEHGTGFDGIGDCKVPECGSKIPDVEIEDPPEKDEIVAPDFMAAHRDGDGKIQPPDSVKTDMVRAGETETRAAIKICVSTSGSVRDVTFIKRTGYDAYDAKLLREIRSWRYQPFTIDGKAVAACSVTHIIFRLK